MVETAAVSVTSAKSSAPVPKSSVPIKRALTPAETMNRPTKRQNLIAGGPGRREGRVQRLARRMLITAGSTAISARTMMEIIYRREPWTHARWRQVGYAARRWAEPVVPRTRPLKWVAKDAVSAADEPKSKT
jgi:hypothetical protein